MSQPDIAVIPDDLRDDYGWPNVDAVLVLLRATSPDGVTEDMIRDAESKLAEVIAEFQSPFRQGQGGTGRLFTPTPLTRFYDGTGFAELRVDDIVPDTTLEVAACDTVLLDVRLKENHPGLGHNVLYRTQSVGVGSALYSGSSFFPRGKQNIRVSAMFGFALQVPDDVWGAVRSEVAYQILIENFVGIEGIGDEIRMGPFQLKTGGGSPQVWEASSPLPVMHKKYETAKLKYRDRGLWRTPRIMPGGRMS